MTWQRRASDGERICFEECRDHFLLKFWGFVVPIFVSNHALQRQAQRGLFIAGLGRTLLRLGPLILALQRSIGAETGHPEFGQCSLWPGGNVVHCRSYPRGWGGHELGRFFREVGGQRICMAVMLLQIGECAYATWLDMEAILGQPPVEGARCTA